MPRKKKITEEEKKNLPAGRQVQPDGGEEKPKGPQVLAYAYGRRKTATARVRIFKGDGKIVVNEKTIEEYFPGTVVKQFWQKPFEVTGTLGRYSATVKVEGSGKSAQLGAVVHGIARSLVVLNPDFRSLLRKAGFLTRDPRAKERRKYGLAQKARKGKQHPKR